MYRFIFIMASTTIVHVKSITSMLIYTCITKGAFLRPFVYLLSHGLFEGGGPQAQSHWQ